MENSYIYRVSDIDSNFTTYGDDHTNLISMDFVKKVTYILKNVNCKLILKDKTITFNDRHINELPKSLAEKPTKNQIDFINDICELYGFDLPDISTKSKAAKWLSKTLKEYDYKNDKKRAETKVRNDKLYADYKNGLPLDDLCEKYSLKLSTLKNLIYKLNRT